MRKSLVIGLVFLAATAAIILAGAMWFLRTDPNSLLLNAAERGDLATVKSLIQQGASINQQYSPQFGWTPLIGAINFRQTNIIQYLIESGANVNLADNHHVTPLMWMMSWDDDSVPMVRYLIAHGANLDAKDDHGATVYSYARSDPPKPELIEVLEAARREHGKSQK